MDSFDQFYVDTDRKAILDMVTQSDSVTESDDPLELIPGTVFRHTYSSERQIETGRVGRGTGVVTNQRAVCDRGWSVVFLDNPKGYPPQCSCSFTEHLGVIIERWEL